MSKTRESKSDSLRRVSCFVFAFLFWIGGTSVSYFAQACDGQTTSVTLKTVSGDSVEGTLESIDLDSVKIQAAQETIEVEFEKIDSIETGNQSRAPEEVPASIELVDGSQFNGTKFSISSRLLTTRLQSKLEVAVETRHISSVRFKDYENKLRLSKQYREIKSDDSREGDAIIVNREGTLTAVEGIAGDFADGKLEFSIGERTARVALEKMDAVLFYHAAGRELALPACEIYFTDASRAVVRRMAWEDHMLLATLVCGTELAVPLESISRLNFSLGRDEFLSQMEPTTNDWNALMTSSAIMEKLRRLKLARANESFKGLPLSLKFSPNDGLSIAAETKQFEQGYAIQGGGKLAFSLGGRFRRLTGMVGFDPDASITGQVKFTVLVDGKVVVEEKLIHQTMKNPIQLDVDIEDAKRLVFQVDYQDNRSTGDQLHLVNLKVSQ